MFLSTRKTKYLLFLVGTTLSAFAGVLFGIHTERTAGLVGGITSSPVETVQTRGRFTLTPPRISIALPHSPLVATDRIQTAVVQPLAPRTVAPRSVAMTPVLSNAASSATTTSSFSSLLLVAHVRQLRLKQLREELFASLEHGQQRLVQEFEEVDRRLSRRVAPTRTRGQEKLLAGRTNLSQTRDQSVFALVSSGTAIVYTPRYSKEKRGALAPAMRGQDRGGSHIVRDYFSIRNGYIPDGEDDLTTRTAIARSTDSIPAHTLAFLPSSRPAQLSRFSFSFLTNLRTGSRSETDLPPGSKFSFNDAFAFRRVTRNRYRLRAVAVFLIPRTNWCFS